MEQGDQIYGTLPNTVYGTRHGMCVLVPEEFQKSTAELVPNFTTYTMLVKLVGAIKCLFKFV